MKALLVQPWIYDFAAFDLWLRPLGLLYIGSVLEKLGYNIYLVDCLDRYDPELLKRTGKIIPRGERQYGCGKFHREEVPRPDFLRHLPRKFCRYGLPPDIFLKRVKELPVPDIILMGSGMTYWYPGTIAAIHILKKIYPTVPLLLGGVYPILMPEHARCNSGADEICIGEGEPEIAGLLNKVHAPNGNFRESYTSLDSYPLPAFHLLRRKDALPLLTSRGCPYRCTYCASGNVSGKFRQRDSDAVVDEVQYHVKKYNTRDFAFFDDALLVRPEKHIIPILERLLFLGINVRFHAHNGLFPNLIGRDIARLMKKSRFTTVRLSLETVNAERKKDIQNKVDVDGFAAAVAHLENSGGYRRKNIEAYIIMGLPGQSVKEVIDTISFAAEQGVLVRLCQYSPVPGTVEYMRAVKAGEVDPDMDPLMTNNTLMPMRSKIFDWDISSVIKRCVRILNDSIRMDVKISERPIITKTLQESFGNYVSRRVNIENPLV